jgi:hypothetical protein
LPGSGDLRGERDGVSETLEAAGEPAAEAFGVAPVEVVGAEIAERLTAGQERIDDAEDGVADRHESALGTPSRRQAAVLGAEIRLGPRGRASRA